MRPHPKIISQVFIVLILVLFSISIGYPALWMIFSSFKTGGEFYSNPWGLPQKFAYLNYKEAWKLADIGRYFGNSVVVTFFTVFLVGLLAAMAAYAFARLKFPGSTFLFYSFLISMIVPAQVTAVPLYVLIRKFHLFNTRTSLVLCYTAGGLAFSIFLLRAFFISIPRELEEAALIDGCSYLGILWRIIFPISKPGLATIAIFQGMGAWNEFFLALLLIREPSVRTIPLGLYVFFTQRVIDWTYVFAFLSTATIPVIILYILLQRQFISGLTAGALKA